MKRLLAWVLLGGFVLLLLNVMFIKFYWELSMVIYLIIAFAFLLYNSKATRARETEEIWARTDGDNNGANDIDDGIEENNEGSRKE